jgi:mannose-6-phosphate isomerase
MIPITLPPNDIERFYRGGAAIAALRGRQPRPGRFPEDWVASTTEAFEEPGVGLSRLPDGRLLRDAIAADPQAWLGTAHVDRWGADPALLVKLLDAGERLPVHAHPSGPVAREHLGTRFGKTEAWVVIGGSGPVWAGWREPVSADQLRAWVERQDAEAMLGALHRVDVEPGDSVFVPAAVPHAIGEGLLILELQEPSDMSVLLEWRGTGVESEHVATVGLGWERGLAAVEHDARDPAELVLRGAGCGDGPARTSALVPVTDPFFRAEWLRPAAAPIALEAGFSVLVVVEGEGQLVAPDGTTLPYVRGDNVVIPHAAGPQTVLGGGALLRCRPPAPDAPEVGAR